MGIQRRQTVENVETESMAGFLARNLPHTTVFEILSHCAPSELAAAAQVCQRWKEACEYYDHMIWPKHCPQHWKKLAAIESTSRDSASSDSNDEERVRYAAMYAKWVRGQAKYTTTLDHLPRWTRQALVAQGFEVQGEANLMQSESPVARPGVHRAAAPGQNYDVLIKLLLIGDASSGKTSLLTRMSDDTFSSSYITTIGVDFRIRTLDIDGTTTKLQIWDTAGQERFRTITSSYYRGAGGIFICYDITCRSSFDNVTHWLREVERYGSGQCQIMLIGCKSDLEARREVSREEGEQLALQHGWDWMETSAKDGIQCDEAMTQMSRIVLAGSGGMVPPSVPDPTYFLREVCKYSPEEIERKYPKRKISWASRIFGNRKHGNSWCSIV